MENELVVSKTNQVRSAFKNNPSADKLLSESSGSSRGLRQPSQFATFF